LFKRLSIIDMIIFPVVNDLCAVQLHPT